MFVPDKGEHWGDIALFIVDALHRKQGAQSLPQYSSMCKVFFVTGTPP